MRFRPANIRLINRRQNLPRLLLALSLKDDENKDNYKNNPIDVQKLTGHSISVLRQVHLHISVETDSAREGIFCADATVTIIRTTPG